MRLITRSNESNKTKIARLSTMYHPSELSATQRAELKHMDYYDHLLTRCPHMPLNEPFLKRSYNRWHWLPQPLTTAWLCTQNKVWRERSQQITPKQQKLSWTWSHQNLECSIESTTRGVKCKLLSINVQIRKKKQSQRNNSSSCLICIPTIPKRAKR